MGGKLRGLRSHPTLWPTAINDKSVRGSDDATTGQDVAHEAALISKNFLNCVIIFYK